MLGMSSQQIRRMHAAAALLVAATLVVTACSSGKTKTATSSSGGGAAGVTKKTGPLHIAYLQKQGDSEYFIDEANGAKQEAAKLGNVTISVSNEGTDSNKEITDLNTAIAQKVDGVVTTVPDQKIGPQVMQAAQTAGIPLISADDPIMGADGTAAPFVGFDDIQMGTKIGTEVAKLYKAAGWTTADTRIMAPYSEILSDCTQREQGEEAGFKAAAGALPKIVKLGTDNSNVDAQNKAGAAITANPGVKHWLVWSCNDEGETGAVSALQNAHISPDDIIGVGLGAYLDCKDWQAGVKSGNKASLYISGNTVGHYTIMAMVNALRNGTALPAKTIVPTQMVDPTNWKAAMGSCT